MRVSEINITESAITEFDITDTAITKEYILNQEEQSSRKIDPIGHLAALAPEDVQGLKNTNFTQPMTHN